MSVGIVCDTCGEATSEFVLPAGFRNENDKNKNSPLLQISIIRGKASLDYCRRCFCNFLIQLANISAPEFISYHEKDSRLVEK